jgi:hypothetical protein
MPWTPTHDAENRVAAAADDREAKRREEKKARKTDGN